MPAAPTRSSLARQRRSALAEAKVLINIHGGEEQYFEWLRVLEAIHAGVRRGQRRRPATSTLCGRASTCCSRDPKRSPASPKSSLDDEDRRLRQRRDALEFIREQLPLRTSVERLVATAETLARTTRGPAGVAASPDSDRLAVGPPRCQRLVSQDPDSSMLRRAIKDLRLDMIDLRRLGLRSILTQEGGTSPPAVVKMSTPRVTAASAV